MKILRSYNIQIWVGRRKHYTNQTFSLDYVRGIVDQYVNSVRDCVTITPTEFRYVDGHEPGVIVGLIQYPRFPRTRRQLRLRAINLAKMLMVGLHQYRVTITTPGRSIMLESKKGTE